MSRTSVKAPLVFRVRDQGLRARLESFAEKESTRTGYRIGTTDIAERAIREFLAGHEPWKWRKDQ